MVEHLYLHIPFCHRICPYCSFHKHKLAGFDPSDYVEALGAELSQEAARHPLRPRTIYAGGGTPSLLSIEQLQRLREILDEHLDLSALEEFDLEANPRTFDLAKAAAFREIGVTRVSLGIQSWTPGELAVLGRDHSPEEGEEAFRLLVEAGIPHRNIDLMFSVPGQTRESWARSLDATLALEPNHISAYNLTYEEDTEYLERMRKGEFAEDENLNADLYEIADTKLVAAGFEHYEISNYARPGHRSRHNEGYWDGADYLGLGAGATSTIGGTRWSNQADTQAYLDLLSEGKEPSRENETLGPDAILLERLALGLRRSEGIDSSLLENQPEILERAKLLESEGLLERGTRLRLTQDGRPLVDPIVVELLRD